ncbi:MAG: 5,6-dimethylbenzimidazole synthase [Methyloligellaceae bacterium]
MQFDATFREQFEELLKWRRDVRQFRADPVDPDLIAHLLTLTDYAPSVGLSQPWRFVAFDEEDQRRAVIESFERCNTEALAAYDDEHKSLYARLKLEGLREAPVQFAVFADEATRKGKGLGRQTMPEMLRYSVVAAINTFWLAARAAGLGVGWVSILEPEAVAQAADAPDSWTLIAYLCVGWPEEESLQPELEREGWEDREIASSPQSSRVPK